MSQIISKKATIRFCREGFGLNRTTKTKCADIEKRVKELEKLTKF
jgi:hypothetical protein